MSLIGIVWSLDACPRDGAVVCVSSSPSLSLFLVFNLVCIPIEAAGHEHRLLRFVRVVPKDVQGPFLGTHDHLAHRSPQCLVSLLDVQWFCVNACSTAAKRILTLVLVNVSRCSTVSSGHPAFLPTRVQLPAASPSPSALVGDADFQ